jgi:hypothetical protein
MWRNFLLRELTVPSGGKVQLYRYVECLLRDGIYPLLRTKQYNLSCGPKELTGCILNYLLRHERDYKDRKFTTYCCKHRGDVFPEEHEFYEEQIPDSAWNNVKTEFAVNWFADEGDFAARIWRNIPLIILSHLDMENSPANQALYESLKTYDEGDESSENEQ